MKKLNIELKIKLDISKPNGAPRKLVNTDLAKKYGWKKKIDLNEGFKLTLADFKEKLKNSKSNLK